MPCLLVLDGGGEAVTLLGVYVYHGGAVGVLDAGKDLDELLHVIAFLQIVIVEAPCLEPVVLALAVALAQGTQVLVDTTMVFGYRHLVVVDHDDDAGAEFGGFVEAFKGFAARERPVADDGYDVFVGATYVARLLQSGGQTDGCRGVAHLEVVVLGALGGRGVAADGVHVVEVAQEAGGAAREHLVGIALVAHVEDKLVCGCVEHVVQRHGGLDKSEVGAYVSAVLAHTVQYCFAGFRGHGLEGLQVQLFQVGWRLYLLYVHNCKKRVDGLRCKVTHYRHRRSYPEIRENYHNSAL